MRTINRTHEKAGALKRYGTELEIEAMTGISRRTLQKDRLLNRNRFPWYKVGRRVLYNLEEVETEIRKNGRGGAPPTPTLDNEEEIRTYLAGVESLAREARTSNDPGVIRLALDTLRTQITTIDSAGWRA